MKSVVGVIGSGSESHDVLCQRIARVVADTDACLLTGGGDGVMASVAQHFKQLKPDGLIVGVLPCIDKDVVHPPPGYPNPWIDVAIQTHLPARGVDGSSMMSRNHINVLSANVLIALPGGAGTLSEISLAIQYGRPVIVYHGDYSRFEGVMRTVPQTGDISVVADFLRKNLPR